MMTNSRSAMDASSRVTFDRVLRELRRRDFGVLSTVTPEGRPHSVGVVYGVSLPGRPFQLYVMTRRRLRKTRNLVENPDVSFVVPLTRRLLWFVPPPCVQFQGRAEVLERDDAGGLETFRSFRMGRRILSMYEELALRGETGVCFLRITPDPTLSTYMVGHTIWELMRRMETGIERVRVP
jgi:nitroimidazol reductase NimA-like FMN-containing flavoprotein (pyridoxamine 5'-phosphate oxidase superfamily)